MTHSDPNRIIVSFCIPVYNNSEGAVKIVNALLSSSDTRFEVVVSDDASTDGVQELLEQIHDDRLRYFRNDQNLGAHQNWLHSLELGRGEWLYLVMGRDLLLGENIDKLIDLLAEAHENDVVYIKDCASRYRPFKRQSKSRFYSGFDAMLKFVVPQHQTGEIFRREVFLAVPKRKHYFSIADMYPEPYAIRDMLLTGFGGGLYRQWCIFRKNSYGSD